jgi:hypothetical protein
MAFHFAASGSATALAESAQASHLAGAASSGLHAATPGLELVSTSAGHPGARPVSKASLSFPLFFEPNVGQTDSRVKFLARGSGYGLFLTADEAVLSLQHPVAKGQPSKSNVIRMHLDGANSSARIQGAEPLPGKSNYFVGNDPSKWHRGISQFARVEYQRVYPGVDLVYYGNQKQLEYDFRVAPGADPNQITLSFKGAAARLDSGDLVLDTADGDIRFQAPRIYQPTSASVTKAPGDLSKSTDSRVAGGFRLIAGNRIGFTVGPYDHGRELVIDPLLSYSTYLGMGGESLCNAAGICQIVGVAVDSADNVYAAGSTTSANFPTTAGAIQTTLNGAQNIFVAVLSPSAGSGSAQLLFATYLGGSGIDSLGGVAVDPVNPSFPNINIYVAGTTSSPDFPTTANAFQETAPVTGTQTHGFLSTINASSVSGGNVFTLSYSTYLAGNTNSGSTTENDVVTGLAVDSFFDAYVTGTTTSSDILTGFPSTPNAYQICPWQIAQSGGTPCPVSSGPRQFFASEINTTGSGPQSMLYSTYFGGGYEVGPSSTGGGIAVDVPSNNTRNSVNMYFTGTTSMPGVPGPNGEAAFPLVNAWQSCLNQSGQTQASGCGAAGANTDAFVVKLNPNQNGAVPSYSTYLGASGNDNGNAVAADNIGNVYVTGSTEPGTWDCVAVNNCTLEGTFSGGTTDAFVAKVANFQGGIFPLVFFAYIGGSGADSGNAIAVDSVQSVHVTGSASANLQVLDPYQDPPYNGGVYGGGASDAFVALVSTTVFTGNTGNYTTYLGGSALDQGTGIAIDNTGTTYIGGVTQSSDFPIANPYQSGLIGAQNAFVTELGSNSSLALSVTSGSPSPNPLPAGTPGTFTFDITNNGPDPASNVTFQVSVPQSGVQTIPTAEVISNGAGSCTNGLTGTIVCQVGTLAAGAKGQVAIFVTPSIPRADPKETIGVTNAQAFANEGQASNKLSESVSVTDFTLNAVVTNPGAEIIAGQLAVVDVTLMPDTTLGYNANLTLTQSSSPSMVTNPSPLFTINPVILTGTSAQGTVLNIQTVPRPVNSGSLFRHRAFYAAWLPIGGLSLAGLGLGAGRKRRRWLIGTLFGLLAGLILLQPACSSGSSAAQSGGGTQAGNYFITITASTGTGAAHQTIVELTVD